MYICVCKAVTDTQIRQAIGQGADSRKALTQCLGVGTGCGKCHRQVSELIAESDNNSCARAGFNQADLMPVSA